MTKINTVLFDLDGTILDTNKLIEKSFLHTFDTFGYSFSKEEIIQFNGPPLVETFSALEPNRVDEMIATYRAHNTKYHEQYASLFPHVKETLAVLKENDIKMGIVSAKMRIVIDQGLEQTGITDYFQTIISIDDVENPKPHPEPVKRGINNLRTTPEQTIMVGDNYHDIQSGNEAGTKTAGVAWSLKGIDFLKKYNPTYIIHDIRELLSIVGV